MIEKYILKLKWGLFLIIALLLVLHKNIQFSLSPPFEPWFVALLENFTFIILALIAVLIIFNLVNFQIIQFKHHEEEYKELSHKLKTESDMVKEKAEIMSKKIDELSTLQKIIRAMNQTMNVDKIMNIILENICRYMSFDKAIMFLISDSDSGKFIEVKHSINVGRDKLKNIKIPLNDRENFIVRTILEKHPRIVRKAHLAAEKNREKSDSASDYFNSMFDGLGGKNRDTVACIPIEAKDNIIGVLVVDNMDSGNAIKEKDLRTLMTFTSQAGLALENARLYQTEKNFKQELQRQVDLAVEKLKKAQRELIMSEKFAALGKMAQVVSHEVRNPLSTIRGSAEVISTKLEEKSPLVKFINYITHEVDRLDKIVTNILTFGHKPKIVLSEENINKLIEQLIDFLEASDFSQYKVECMKELDKSLPVIQFDPDKVEQVLLNIIQNAAHFMEKRSIRQLTIKTYNEDGYAKISISDTGPGIPRENRNKIFEPFFTTKAKGTGLGLSISKNIIELHGGEFEVSSEENIGTTFIVSLPLEREEKKEEE